jgi:3',5'-cyclic AMP phosphodiesterase CpdA
MQIIYQTEGFDFVSMLGDLAYPGGFSASPEKEFRELFVEPFEGIHVPFYPVLGDNDYGSDEVQSSFQSYLQFGQQDPRWRMEGLYYHHIHKKGDVSVCAIHIDTQSMVKVLYPESRTAEELEFLNAQLPWLEGVLSSSECQQTDFITVFAHNPLISASRKGNKGSTSTDLRSILLPLFKQYYVDAYFSGHDHDLQALTYSEPNEHVISFIVSGSSSRIRSKTFNGPLDGIEVWRCIDRSGFTISEVTKEFMVTRFVASDSGETLHMHHTVSHRRLRVPGGSS